MSDIIHTVAKAETVTKINAKYGITLSKFKAFNPKIKDVNKISIGQKVKVGEEIETIEDDVLITVFDDNIIYYVVPKGQTLAGLAKLTAMSEDELKVFNNINNTQSQLISSKFLKIPFPTITVKEGDTLGDIYKDL